MRAESVDGMELARRGAAFLYRQGATQVWVFGSVAKGRRLDFRSDIDFAVQGIPSERSLLIGAELEELLEFPVDLIELERASAGLREQIEAHRVFLPHED